MSINSLQQAKGLLVPGKKCPNILRRQQGYFRDISPFLNVEFTSPPVLEYFFPIAGLADFLPGYVVRVVSGPKCARPHKGKAAQTAATELL